MRIGDAAAAAGLTPRALRFYEQQGLLAARRMASGHREYGPDDVDRLRAVRELTDAGLTIRDIQALVPVLDVAFPPEGGTSPTVRHTHVGGCPVAEVAARRLANLDERIARLTEVRDRLDRALTHEFGGLFHGAVRPHRAA
ncbi:MerR family transcriptional regulator [Nonomuraea sp. CA-141351]|uniref:MerR family transcriptional regulator n=1 Tax=Nonomuraea sp. CA-141351 TaxID=3239996 RepID=UPI003D932395